MPKEQRKPVYHRILLKLSGESLAGDKGFGVDPVALDSIASAIRELCQLDIEIAIVIGGGNLFRGEALAKQGLDRITSDQIGMMATIMNGLVLRDRFLREGIKTHVMSAIAVRGISETYDRALAISYLKAHEVVIFVGGTGSPLFSTDSAASLRAIEIGADVVLKATKVDGVYSDDPHVNKNAKRFDRLTYQEVVERQLRVMDAAAICLCRDHNMPLRVFNMNQPGILKDIIYGSNDGTRIE